MREYISKARGKQDAEALQIACKIITKPGSSRQGISPDIYVLCAEAALQLGCVEITKACLKMYFEGNPPANQFLCRAYLCQGQLESPPATGSVDEFEKTVDCYLKAIEIAKHKPSYHSLVFNASVLYFQTVRPLLQPGRSVHLLSSLGQVVRSLEEVNDPDHSWRAQLMMQLIKCFVDAEKMDDAKSFAKVTEEFVKSNSPQLYPELFSLLIQHSLSDSDVLLEMSRQSPTLTAIYKLQEFKMLGRLNEDELKEEDCAKLGEMFNLLASTKESSLETPPPAVRVAFLLELALLALQTKNQKVAADCLKELKTAKETSVGQRIIMECMMGEISLLKKEAKINEYSKAAVEARLREIGRLDQCLLNASRVGDPRAMQAVCVTQWRICLPLLQHNLRKNIRTPLLRVAQVLEDIQSQLLETRCQVHSELALIEEEKGRLEAALTHLHKALLLDHGKQRERLSSAVRLLQLRTAPYQSPPSQSQERAAMLMQQVKDMPNDNTDSRPVLVSVGLLLAPDDFQVVLEADDPSNVAFGIAGSGPAAELCAKAQHHSTSVQMVNKHLVHVEGTDHTERVKLWALLAKTARKQEVWDVCRAACRFCLLYIDGRWNVSKTNTKKTKDPEAEECTSKSGSPVEYLECNRDLFRLFAEIYFINAEAVVHKLHTEGVQLNGRPVPPVVKGQDVSEDDADWIVYRDWILSLSAYASSSFLRAAEIGAEISEPWVVANAAIYLWNYNNHLLSDKQYQLLLPTFKTVVDLMQKIQYKGDSALFAMLCNAVALGLIQPLSRLLPVETAPPVDKGRAREKGAASVSGPALDQSALQDARKALELCELALQLSSGGVPGETVPIAVRSHVVSTWVQTKRILQQQIGSVMDLGVEGTNEEVSAMTRVLIGLEMFQCSRSPGQMDFSLPPLSSLVNMASECSWSDAVVGLQVWCQLAAFCHESTDHSLVLSCTERALELKDKAAKSLSNAAYALFSHSAVNEMLSSVACLRALSLVHQSYGDLHRYREAMELLLSSVRYAEKAGSASQCIRAARHYWNTCLPLAQTPEERVLLRDPLEMIMNALLHTNSKLTNKQKQNILTATISKPEASSDELSVRAAMYSLLLQIHIDNSEWKSAQQLLERALRDMPRGKHRLSLQKCLTLVKARCGDSVVMEIQNLEGEGEQCSAFMWHRVALCSQNMTKKLSCYKRAIDTLTSTESQWQKVSILLEFSEWMFFNNFPKFDALQMVQWAIDILLLSHTEQMQQPEGQSKNNAPVADNSSSPVSSSPSVSNLRDVKCLDALIRAHTLLAVMSGRTSPDHQLNLLRAYSFVIQMWKVSMAEASDISSDMTKVQPQSVTPASAGSKIGKDKNKGKGKKMPSEEEKPILTQLACPVSLKDWVYFSCPDHARHVFKNNNNNNNNPRCLNTRNITKQPQTLFYLNFLEKELHSLSLTHLTLPVLHLAETIAHDLMDLKSLSGLYRLRIVRACCELGLETSSPYHQKLQSLSGFQEQELIGCKRSIVILQEKNSLHQTHKQKTVMEGSVDFGHQSADICAQNIWLDKADVCLSMGLYQQARHFLTETHSVATELEDQISVGRSLLSLAVLAYEEQSYAQALILLDQAQASGGDEDFWYQLTLTRVRATMGKRDQCVPAKNVQAKIDDIVKQGCEVLRSLLDKQVNRRNEVTFLITLLQMRGAVECIRAVTDVEPGRTLCPEAALRLKTYCDKLQKSSHDFTELQYREQAAETLTQHSHGLRILAQHTTEKEKKQRLLMEALDLMQSAVSELEQVALNSESLLPPQEESPCLSLAVLRRLLLVRLALAKFCLDVFEEHCTERRLQALARTKKSAAEIILEDFTCPTPEPNSIQQAWLNAGTTLGQVALAQLAAVNAHYLNTTETEARYLGLMGKYLRLQATMEDPVYVSALWDPHKQEAWIDSQTAGVDLETLEKDQVSNAKEERISSNSAQSTEQQITRNKAKYLLAQAAKSLSEASSLCLHHQLPPSILTDAALNMIECHGLSDPTVTGQYLPLYQSCLSVTFMSKVLTSTFSSDTSESQLSALLHLQSNLLLSQDERPSSRLQATQAILNTISKAFSQLAINPNHLTILSELPPNMKLLLLQHSEDRKELYGAFYEVKTLGNHKGKPAPVKGLMCSKVAKAAVCPRALLALLDRARTLSQETSQVRLGGAHKRRAQGGVGSVEDQDISAAEQVLVSLFRELIQEMENYLNPLLSQFDFSSLRPVAASAPAPEPSRPKEKEEKASSATFLSETADYLVLLADHLLLELPLEALSVLQEEGLTSVTRDFSIQLLYSRLQQSEKVEVNNKKETKGGKGTKGKGDQSQAIKARPFVLPPNTIPVNGKNFKYVVDPYNEGIFDGTSLSKRMSEILETHSQQSAHLWEGFTGSKCKPSMAEIEQLLSRCSAFIFLGMERFMGNLSPAKIAALNLSECNMALLFDLVQNKSSVARQSDLNQHKRPGQLALEDPLETALLLSLGGVGCILLNQWHSSFQLNTANMASILDSLFKDKQTSGQALYSLRKGHTHSPTSLKENVITSDDHIAQADVQRHYLTPSTYNCVLYGLPNLIVP